MRKYKSITSIFFPPFLMLNRFFLSRFNDVLWFTLLTQARFRNAGPSLVDSTQVPPPSLRPTTKQVAGRWKLALKDTQLLAAGWEASPGRNKHRGPRRDPGGRGRRSPRFRTTQNFSAASLADVPVARARGRKDTVCCLH